MHHLTQRTGPRRAAGRSDRARSLALGVVGLALALATGLAFVGTDHDRVSPDGATHGTARRPENLPPSVTAVATGATAPAESARRRLDNASSQSASIPAPVVGRLIGPDGSPRIGTLVQWQSDGVRTAPAARTTANGRFRLLVQPRMRGALALTGGHLAFEEAPAARAVSGAGLDVGDLVVVVASRINGAVVDPDGAPIDGAHVTVQRRVRGADTRALQTDLRGRFELTGVAPGSYSLRATSERFVARRLEFEVSSDRPLTQLRIELDRGHALHGFVVDGGGNGVANAAIALGTAGAEPARPLSRIGQPTRSRSNGAFELRAADAEVATVAAWSSEHGPCIAEVDFGAPIELRLERRGAIAGRLVDDRGQPLAGSRIVASPHRSSLAGPDGTGPLRAAALLAAWPTAERIVTTDAQGHFALSRVPAGDWQLQARGTSHLPVRPRPVAVRPGETNRITLRGDRGRTLTVRVQDPDGRPLAGAEVALFHATDPAPLQKADHRGALVTARASDSGGTATFIGLTAGDFVVEARSRDYAASAPLNVLLGDDGAEVTVAVAGGGWIDILAQQGSGEPGAAIGCCVVTATKPARVVWRGRTSDAGTARSARLTPGAYVVALLPDARGIGKVDAAAALRAGQRVAVTADSTEQVQLLAPTLATLRGTLFGNRGVEVGAEVRVAPLLGAGQSLFIARARHAGRTDGAGSYEIRDLRPGRYRVQFGRVDQPFRFEQDLHVVAGRSDYVLDCDMATGSARFVVFSAATGEPVPNARVSLLRDAPAGAVAQGSYLGHADREGSVRRAGLVPGTYRWTATAAGFGTTTGTIEVTTAGQSEHTITLQPKVAGAGRGE